MVRTLDRWISKLVAEWNSEDRARMRRLAHEYGERAQMDGEIVRATGEVIPKESV